jgi:hypothetical protein
VHRHGRSFSSQKIGLTVGATPDSPGSPSAAIRRATRRGGVSVATLAVERSDRLRPNLSNTRVLSGMD